MPKIAYERKRFGARRAEILRQANRILEEYALQGYDLTLRQLYYQFVARDLLPNVTKSYSLLGAVVNEGRLAGLIDWDYIVDRTRNLRDQPHWRDPAHVIHSTTSWFHIDLWKDQPYRLEVWIEKDALVGVIERPCESMDVPYFACRGYVSQSEMWAAGQRLGQYIDRGQKVVILHLGDHDPSGIDMTRDIEQRLFTFLVNDHYHDKMEGSSDDPADSVGWIEEHFKVERLALNMDQVREYDPPPNPAKMSDSRYASYITAYGDESWELDALEPTVLGGLITDAVDRYLEPDLFDAATAKEREFIDLLRKASSRWPEVEALLNGNGS
jgi:hypothetical protein